MAILDIDWNPDEKKLRVFSIGWLVLFAILGGLTGWKHYDKFGADQPWTWCYVLWAVGVAVFFLGRVKPGLVYYPYVALTAVTFPIGWTISHLVLALIYFGLFTPIALVFRLKKRDELHLRYDPEKESYWTKRPASASGKRYFQQF